MRRKSPSPVGQHERDPVARHDVALDQAGRNRARPLGKVSVAHRGGGGHVVVQHRDVQTVGMLVDMPLQHLKQRARVAGGRTAAMGGAGGMAAIVVPGWLPCSRARRRSPPYPRTRPG